MNFGQISDGVRLHHHHHEFAHHSARAAIWPASSSHPAIDAGDASAGDSSFSGAAAHAPLAMFSPLNAALASFHGGDPWPGSGAIASGANAAGNGGDGYFYGGVIHAALIIYEPIKSAWRSDTIPAQRLNRRTM